MTSASSSQSGPDPFAGDLAAYDNQDELGAAPLAEGRGVLEAEDAIRLAGGRLVHARRRRLGSAPRGVSADDFARFNELLAASVKRDMPLLEGVRRVARDIRSPRFRQALELVAADLERGRSAREAFESVSDRFPPIYGRLMQAGVKAHSLGDVLLAVSRNVRRETAFRRSVLEALAYPLMMLVAAAAFLTGFAFMLLPILQGISREVAFSNDIPHGVVSFLVGLRPTTLAGLAAGAVAAVILVGFHLRSSPWGHGLREAALRRLPLLRTLYEAAVWAAAADTLSMLFKAGTPAPEALALTGEAVGSQWVHFACACMADAVERGESLSQAARTVSDVPMPMVRAFDSGDASGCMAEALAAAARQYREYHGRRARLVSECLPPVLAVLIGVVLFFLALAVVGPYIEFMGAAW